MNFTQLYELYHCFPQRVVVGVTTTEESPLASKNFTGSNGRKLTVSSLYGKTHISTETYLGTGINHEDTASLALSILAADSRKHVARHLQSSNTMAAGYDGDEGRVYVPKDDQQALRNLNFAIANLAAYERYQTVVKPEQEAAKKKAEEALKALREEAKRKEEAEAKAKAEAKRREELHIEKKALKIFNASRGTGYTMWPTFMGQASRDKWIALAKQAEVINSTSPTPQYPDSLFSRGGYNSAIFPSVFSARLDGSTVTADIRKAYGL